MILKKTTHSENLFIKQKDRTEEDFERTKAIDCVPAIVIIMR